VVILDVHIISVSCVEWSQQMCGWSAHGVSVGIDIIARELYTKNFE